MPKLLDILNTVEACDNRNFIQILNQQVTEFIIDAKVQACDRATEVLAEYGIENFQPCEVITEEFLERLNEGEVIIGLENLLENQGFPPHTIRFISRGPAGLTINEYQDVLVWTTPLTGVQVQQNTAQYIRDITANAQTPQVLDEAKKREVEEYYQKQGIQNLTTYFQNKLLEYISSKLKCPPLDVVNRLLTIARNLNKYLTKAQQALAKIEDIARVVSGIVNIISNTIPILKKIVTALDLVGIPVLAATPVIGRLAAILANIARKISQFLIKFEDRIKELAEALCATSSVITFANAGLTLAFAFLQMIEELLKGCIVNEIGDNLELASQFTPSSFDSRQSVSYRGYRLEVRTARDNTTIPLRYAVALDPVGVVVLEGPRSFSSSTQVLIDELKFRIDNQLG